MVDQTDGTITFPTGELLNTRTMEHFRRWGITQRVRGAGFPPNYRRVVRFVTRVMRHQLTCFERTGNAEPSRAEAAVSPEWPCWCPKLFLDPVLRAYAVSFSQVDLRFGWRFEGLFQDEGSVEADLVEVATERRTRIRARYLVGCDGGSSSVRGAIGVSLTGTYAEGQNLAIFFRAPTLLSTNPHGTASQYWLVNRDARGPVSAVDGRELWRLSVDWTHKGLEEVDPSHIVREALGADLPFEVLAVRPWAGHRVVAERYRASRVFLAGDSAHMMWPRGGFGLNTGVGDAVDLGWKLAAVFQGWGGPGLLESYGLERRPVGCRNVNVAAENRAAEMAVPIPEHLEEEGERGERVRAAVADVIKRTRAKEWASLGIQLGYRYDRSPTCVADGTPAPSDIPSVYEPVARPGARAPHAWLGDGRSVLDLFGHGFTLLTFGMGSADLAGLKHAATERSLPLSIVRVEEPAVRELYERRLVLVRPDGHVAWRADAAPADPGALLDRVRGFGGSADLPGTPRSPRHHWPPRRRPRDQAKATPRPPAPDDPADRAGTTVR
jgi:2-polyprenyl-6-methoxyphenol hydroxylase-like FAD-dependent oxidoreductase